MMFVPGMVGNRAILRRHYAIFGSAILPPLFTHTREVTIKQKCKRVDNQTDRKDKRRSHSQIVVVQGTFDG